MCPEMCYLKWLIYSHHDGNGDVPESDEWHKVVSLVVHVHGQAKQPGKDVHS